MCFNEMTIERYALSDQAWESPHPTKRKTGLWHSIRSSIIERKAVLQYLIYDRPRHTSEFTTRAERALIPLPGLIEMPMISQLVSPAFNDFSDGYLTHLTDESRSKMPGPLTEYAATSSPKKASVSSQLPETFLLPDGFPDYIGLILDSPVDEVVEQTPLTQAINVSNRLQCRVLLKREDLTPVFSFKIRGAYNKLASLTDDERWKGVIACSAGERAVLA